MNGVLHYLIERVASLGIISPERSNLFIALDEAFVNAVKHGNKNDPNKLVRITADLSTQEARFHIEDEGEGFDPVTHPGPARPDQPLQDVWARRAFDLQHHGRSHVQ
jgi:serine/threonine-protein kinase RsbW